MKWWGEIPTSLRSGIGSGFPISLCGWDGVVGEQGRQLGVAGMGEVGELGRELVGWGELLGVAGMGVVWAYWELRGWEIFVGVAGMKVVGGQRELWLGRGVERN